MTKSIKNFEPKHSMCSMRPDLIAEGSAIPIGNAYYIGPDKMFFRWLDDDTFQIFYKGEWHEAYSIDFEF